MAQRPEPAALDFTVDVKGLSTSEQDDLLQPLVRDLWRMLQGVRNVTARRWNRYVSIGFEAKTASRTFISGIATVSPPIVNPQNHDIIVSELSGSKDTEQASPESRPEDVSEPAAIVLNELEFTLASIQRLQEDAQRLVDQARELGATWSAVGAVAGIKAQAAQQRWSESGREHNRERQRRRRQRPSSDQPD